MTDIYTKIITRQIKYRYAPFLLKPEEYWNYIRTYQLSSRAWDVKTIPVLLIFGALAVGVLYYLKYEPLIIQIVATLFVVLAIFEFIRGLTSKTARIKWYSLCILYLVILTASIWFVFINLIALIPLYYALAHLIAVLRIRKLAFSAID